MTAILSLLTFVQNLVIAHPFFLLDTHCRKQSLVNLWGQSPFFALVWCRDSALYSFQLKINSIMQQNGQFIICQDYMSVQGSFLFGLHMLSCSTPLILPLGQLCFESVSSGLHAVPPQSQSIQFHKNTAFSFIERMGAVCVAQRRDLYLIRLHRGIQHAGVSVS